MAVTNGRAIVAAGPLQTRLVEELLACNHCALEAHPPIDIAAHAVPSQAVFDGKLWVLHQDKGQVLHGGCAQPEQNGSPQTVVLTGAKQANITDNCPGTRSTLIGTPFECRHKYEARHLDR